jgi:hypothetical protein
MWFFQNPAQILRPLLLVLKQAYGDGNGGGYLPPFLFAFVRLERIDLRGPQPSEDKYN